jgi:uncharacterized membrane protein
MPMNRLDRLLAGVLWCLGVLFTAAAIHILAVFNLPKLLGKDPYSRLSALAKTGEMTVLPRTGAGTGWAPFADPALAQGACLYDLSREPIRLTAETDSDRMLTLSFRTPAGDIFYSMTDRAAQHGKIDVLILTADQLENLEAETDDDDEAPQELRLVAPTTKGFVLVNAFAPFPSERLEAEQRVKAIRCAPEGASG